MQENHHFKTAATLKIKYEATKLISSRGKTYMHAEQWKGGRVKADVDASLTMVILSLTHSFIYNGGVHRYVYDHFILNTRCLKRA